MGNNYLAIYGFIDNPIEKLIYNRKLSVNNVRSVVQDNITNPVLRANDLKFNYNIYDEVLDNLRNYGAEEIYSYIFLFLKEKIKNEGLNFNLKEDIDCVNIFKRYIENIFKNYINEHPDDLVKYVEFVNECEDEFEYVATLDIDLDFYLNHLLEVTHYNLEEFINVSADEFREFSFRAKLDVTSYSISVGSYMSLDRIKKEFNEFSNDEYIHYFEVKNNLTENIAGFDTKEDITVVNQKLDSLSFTITDDTPLFVNKVR